VKSSRWSKLRNEEGSAELFAFMLTFPLLLALLFFAWMTMSYRDYLRLPVEQVVNSYTQQFAAYGSNTPPDYAAFTNPGEGTVTDQMQAALLATGNVSSVVPGSVFCGPLLPDGRIDANGVVYANTAVGCEAKVDLYAWPYESVFDLTDVLFGGEYRVYSTSFTDKGANPNIR
jgi:hypothetical protein